MSIPLPLRTDLYTVYELDTPASRIHQLSLAVTLLDVVTNRPPTIPVRVTVEQKVGTGRLTAVEPITNRSGDRCFEDLPNGNYYLNVEPDASADYYFPCPDGNGPWPAKFSRDISLPADGPHITIKFCPKPGYPFPSGATLIRGQVRNNNGIGVAGADLIASYVQSAPGADPHTEATVIARSKADNTGFFALYFEKLARRSSPQTVPVTAIGAQTVTQMVTLVEHGEVTKNLQFP